MTSMAVGMLLIAVITWGLLIGGVVAVVAWIGTRSPKEGPVRSAV